MIEILYEDKSIIVCVKPSGMLSERSDDAKSLPMMIERERGLSELFVVHRLDREVFGVMVYAKSSKAAARLSEQLKTCDVTGIDAQWSVCHGSIGRVFDDHG